MKYIIVFLLVLLAAVQPVFAAPASLSFDPVNIQTEAGKTTAVTINIFTGSQPVASTDIWLSYDPAILQPEPDSMVNGSLFDTVEVKTIEPGTLYFYGIQKNPRDVEPVQGTLATLHFTALKAGTASLRFKCETGKKNTSQIIAADTKLSNIISCPATVAHSASISVSDADVLGISADNSTFTRLSYILGIIVVIFSVILFIRYQRIRHEIS